MDEQMRVHWGAWTVMAVALAFVLSGCSIAENRTNVTFVINNQTQSAVDSLVIMDSNGLWNRTVPQIPAEGTRRIIVEGAFPDTEGAVYLVDMDSAKAYPVVDYYEAWLKGQVTIQILADAEGKIRVRALNDTNNTVIERVPWVTVVEIPYPVK